MVGRIPAVNQPIFLTSDNPIYQFVVREKNIAGHFFCREVVMRIVKGSI